MEMKNVNIVSMRDEAPLRSRLERLKRTEKDLVERLARHRSALERQDRWHESDPLHQRLYFALDAIRKDLLEAEAPDVRGT